MNLRKQIQNYLPYNCEEEKDKEIMVRYMDTFDDILTKYTKNYELERIKTIDLGALFELTYHVTLSANVNEKEFIDELRCRNGNLTILLTAIDDKTSFKG